MFGTCSAPFVLAFVPGGGGDGFVLAPGGLLMGNSVNAENCMSFLCVLDPMTLRSLLMGPVVAFHVVEEDEDEDEDDSTDTGLDDI